MTHVLTLIAGPKNGPLTRDQIRQAQTALDPLGIDAGDAKWLADDLACDVMLGPCDGDQVEAAVTTALGDAAIDCFAQPVEGRRKQLLLADMDSTIIAEESLDELAAYVGIKEQIAAITARAMAGELDFEAAITERVGLLKDLPEIAIHKAVEAMTINPGAAELVATMRSNGATCLLVSGGFEHFTGVVAAKLGFNGHQGNRLEIADGKMTGRISGPIRDQESKLKTLRETARSLKLSMEQTITVGDGANDVPMLMAAGSGVAYYGKPIARESARFRVQHSDLTALLYLQGYRQAEFKTAI
jgi:phosphoserine phosphatase